MNKLFSSMLICLLLITSIYAADFIFSLGGGKAGIDYALSGPEGLKFAKNMVSLAGEIDYFYSSFLFGATYTYMYQVPGDYTEWSTSICAGPKSTALSKVRISMVGLRLGIGTSPNKPYRVVFALGLEKISSKLFYPGFEDPVIDKGTVASLEQKFLLSLTPSRSGHRGYRSSKVASPDIGLFVKCKYLIPPNLYSSRTQPSGYQIQGGLYIAPKF